MQGIVLTMLLAVTLIDLVKAQESTPSKKTQGTPEEKVILGTEVDPATWKEILRRDEQQNQGNLTGNAAMEADVFADNLLFIDQYGKVRTKQDFVRTQTALHKETGTRRTIHDDFRMRRYGDVIIESGRSITVLPDGSHGTQRRYLAIWNVRNGKWWLVGRQTSHVFREGIDSPIDENVPPSGSATKPVLGGGNRAKP